MSFGEELISDLGRSGLKILTGEVIWDAGSINDGDEAVTTMVVEGASLGDWVIGISADIDVLDLQLNAVVTTNNTVEVQLSNSTGLAVNLDSATYRALVLTHDPN